MTEQLKPLLCPFCGSAPKTIERPDNIDGTRFFYAVACYCGGYSACAHKMAVEPTPEQAKHTAIEAWNRRAQPAQAGQVLTDEEISSIAIQNPPDVHLYARAIEQAVLAKLVPMTDEQADNILLACMPLTNPHRLIRAVERHHGIVGEKGCA